MRRMLGSGCDDVGVTELRVSREDLISALVQPEESDSHAALGLPSRSGPARFLSQRRHGLTTIVSGTWRPGASPFVGNS